MTRTFLLFPLTLLTVLLSTTSSAQIEPEQEERWFQAEIIVFEIREKNTIDSQEIWPDDPGQPNYEDIIELSPIDESSNTPRKNALPDGVASAESGAVGDAKAGLLPPETVNSPVTTENAERPFQLLPDAALTMTESAEALDRSTNYAPLLHIAWRQPVVEKAKAQTIYIHGEQIDISHQGQTTIETTPAFVNINTLTPPSGLIDTPSLLAAQNGITNTSKQGPINKFEGTIKLHLGRYLHLEADLLYRSQIEPMVSDTFLMNLSEAEQPQTLFRMHQTRRMRSGELHYFDHPMFGLLVQITPYELPEPEPEPEPETKPEVISVPTDLLTSEDSKDAKPLP